MNKHQFVECGCGKPGCAFCHGVKVCKQCQGTQTPQESTLTTECCGYFLDWKIFEAIQSRGVDYIHGHWVDQNDQRIDLLVYLGLDDVCEGLT